jgi:hypothetical protein
MKDFLTDCKKHGVKHALYSRRVLWALRRAERRRYRVHAYRLFRIIVSLWLMAVFYGISDDSDTDSSRNTP